MLEVLMAVTGAAGVAGLLVTAGYALGQRGQARVGEAAYLRGQRLQRIIDGNKLRQLRVALETDGGGVTAVQACLLYDVCLALRLDEREAQRIVGPAYWLVLDTPVDDAALPRREEDIDGDVHDAR